MANKLKRRWKVKQRKLRKDLLDNSVLIGSQKNASQDEFGVAFSRPKKRWEKLQGIDRRAEHKARCEKRLALHNASVRKIRDLCVNVCSRKFKRRWLSEAITKQAIDRTEVLIHELIDKIFKDMLQDVMIDVQNAKGCESAIIDSDSEAEIDYQSKLEQWEDSASLVKIFNPYQDYLVDEKRNREIHRTVRAHKLESTSPVWGLIAKYEVDEKRFNRSDNEDPDEKQKLLKVTDGTIKNKWKKLQVKRSKMQSLPGSSTDRPDRTFRQHFSLLQQEQISRTTRAGNTSAYFSLLQQDAIMTHLGVVDIGLPPEPIYVRPTYWDLPHN